jgi:hypothetical protein
MQPDDDLPECYLTATWLQLDCYPASTYNLIAIQRLRPDCDCGLIAT